MNSSLTSGVFPDIWKFARVAPIFKAGTRDDLNNYRPISVLCTISKVFEKIVHDQVVNYLVGQRILLQNQYAYRKLHSTSTSVKRTDDWLSTIDSKLVSLALFSDLKEAFDTIDHIQGPTGAKVLKLSGLNHTLVKEGNSVGLMITIPKL